MPEYPKINDKEHDLLKKIVTNTAGITGGIGSGGEADTIIYNNVTSGLSATEVQSAIDEVVAELEERIESVENTTVDGQVIVYNGTNGKSGKKNTGTGSGKLNNGVLTAVPLHYQWTFDPKAVCDGNTDRLALMRIGPDLPNGLKITRWNFSFLVDPTTEVDLDFKRADAFIGVANSAVVDVLDSTSGASSETTESNINGDVAVANGKVLYLEFGTAYSAEGEQCIFEFWGYGV